MEVRHLYGKIITANMLQHMWREVWKIPMENKKLVGTEQNFLLHNCRMTVKQIIKQVN